MRTQIAKAGYLPAEYIPPIFLTCTPPPPIPQVDGGGCYREKFFLFLFLWFARNLSGLCIENIFFIFLWLRSYSDSYSILFRISVVLTHYKFSLDILLVYICSILSRLRFLTSLLIFDSYFLFSRLVFTRINFDLFQHCRFYVLTLLLVINKHLCLYEFVLCLF